VAAPSANPSGRLSPSSAAHVAKLFQNHNDRSALGVHEDHEDDENAEIEAPRHCLEWIVDGGNCECGLESTVLDLSSSLPKLLRYGSVSVMELKNILGEVALPEQDESVRSPGMLLKHYAPKCKLRLNYSFNEQPCENEALIAFGSIAESLIQSQSKVIESDLKILFRKIINISPNADLDEAASKLFSSLHELESLGVASIAVMPIPDFAVGKAINDRLLRAARGAEDLL